MRCTSRLRPGWLYRGCISSLQLAQPHAARRLGAVEVRERGEHARVDAGFALRARARRRAAPIGTRATSALQARAARRLGHVTRSRAGRRARARTRRRSGAATTSVIVSRSIVGRQDAVRAADVVEHEARGGRARSSGWRRRSRRSAPSARRMPADLVDRRGDRRRRSIVIRRPQHGVALHLALAEARQRDRVQAAEAAAHDRHDLVGPRRRGARGPSASTRPLLAQDLAGSASGHRSIGCHACSRRNAWSSSTSGNAAPNRSAHIGLIATTTSPFSHVAEEHVAERERDALRDQVEQVARRRRCGCRRAGTCPCRRARSRRPGRRRSPRRSASDGHGDRSSHSPMQNPKRAGCPNTVLRRLPRALPADVAQAQRDRAADRHRAPAGGAAHAARRGSRCRASSRHGPFTMQHREHARRRGREPERVPLRLGDRLERGEHERERGRLARRPSPR